MGAPDEVWSADFQGHFNSGDGRYGSPSADLANLQS
jgi:hypothetical protein